MFLLEEPGVLACIECVAALVSDIISHRIADDGGDHQQDHQFVDVEQSLRSEQSRREEQ